MTTIFRDYLHKFVLVYLDDIVVYSNDVQTHTQHLNLILERLRAHHLYANPDKSAFYRQKLPFLGFIQGDGKVEADPHKLAAINNMRSPTTVREVRVFLGMCTYLRKFIPNYSKKAAPLFDTLKKGRPWSWGQDQEKAIAQLKTALTTPPVLALPDATSNDYTLHTDASLEGLGGVLYQQQNNAELHVIAYESRRLTPAEKNYTTHEQELLAIVHCFRVFRCYLDGATTTVHTDHQSLTHFTTTFNLSRRLTRWLEFLSRFDYKIVYKSGKTNVVADALSRLPPNEHATLNAIDWAEDVPAFLETGKLPTDASTRSKVKLHASEFDWDANTRLLWHKKGNQRLPYLPEEQLADFLHALHRTLGHSGINALSRAAQSRVWWPNIKEDVQQTVATCHQCQTQLPQRPNQRWAESHPYPPHHAIFGRWHIDFIGRLPKSTQGNTYILVAVESVTRWVEAEATVDASATTVAKFIYNRILVNFGAPVEIVSDRGKSFLSTVVRNYLSLLPTHQKFSTAFHSRTNATVERVNGSLGKFLAKAINGAVCTWDRHLPQAMFAYRVHHHRVLNCTPFEALFGVPPRLPAFDVPPALYSADEGHPTTEANWIGPYQVKQRHLFDTYSLEDPSGRVLPVLVHRDRLHTAELKAPPTQLWARHRPSNRQLALLEGTEHDDEDNSPDEDVSIPE